ncbi:hypothetical protein ElyMa_005850100 [Elysia marginata]|uniref:Uncharacterized protein n=1 Tax=Elysia marginata TaxID=1093978 RepID=A0AAV4FZ11_9GAST|nr:hypothetical protein ElyMa_005850100 [Elysia marginata]
MGFPPLKIHWIQALDKSVGAEVNERKIEYSRTECWGKPGLVATPTQHPIFNTPDLTVQISGENLDFVLGSMGSTITGRTRSRRFVGESRAGRSRFAAGSRGDLILGITWGYAR